MTMGELTRKEAKTIRALQRLAADWPKGLWLFAANGRIYVMRTASDGARAMNGESVDPAYILESVSIPSDGGDW